MFKLIGIVAFLTFLLIVAGTINNWDEIECVTKSENQHEIDVCKTTHKAKTE